MRKLFGPIAFAVALALALPVVWLASQGIDVAINQTRPPVCNPVGATRVLQYNVVDGKWHCRAVGSATYVGGTNIAGGASTDAQFTKRVTGIVDNVATLIATVSVPNATSAASIPVVLTASLGAGGAIGASECTATAYGQIVITRTPGVATVATATALADTGSACVAGATTITLAYSVSAMTGAVGATQTFNILATITKGGGSSALHTLLAQFDVVNANAGGIQIIGQ